MTNHMFSLICKSLPVTKPSKWNFSSGIISPNSVICTNGLFELRKSVIKSDNALRKLPLTEKALLRKIQQRASVFKHLESAF